MFNSTDPYSYGQNSVEYNQNGDSYNGKTGSMTSGSVMNAGLQGGGSTSSNPFEGFLTHAMALSNYVNGGNLGGNDFRGMGPGDSTGGGTASQGMYPTPSVRPGVTGTIGQPTQPVVGRQPGYGMPQPPIDVSNDVGFTITSPPLPSRPGVTGTIGQPPASPQLIDNGGYIGPNVSPTGQSGLSGITGDSPAPAGQSWGQGQYQFVQGYGWTSSPEEYQAAQNQVAQQAATPASAPSSPAATPGPAPAPGTPQAGSVQDMIHKMLSPLFQQQQGDLTRQMNANAAVTGDINSGGYSGTGPSSLNRGLSDLMAQQGQQESGYLQQANEDALQRALQLQLGQLGLQGTKYSADQGLAGARYGANATAQAANTAANASMQNAGLNYNLGLGNLDVSRENNLLSFMANMYGMTPQMLSALLAGSPESLLSGQTVPTGNIIVKP